MEEYSYFVKYTFAVVLAILYTVLKIWILPPVCRLLLPPYRKLSARDESMFCDRITAILNSVIVVVMSVFVYFADENYYYKHDLFYHEPFGDLMMWVGIGFWFYHFPVCIVPEWKNYPLHIPHHILVTGAILIVVHGRIYLLAMTIMFFTELGNPFAQSVYLLQKLELRKSFVFQLNGILLWVAWGFSRIGGLMYLYYCYYVNWDRITNELSAFVKFYFVICTAFVTFINFWWYFKITRGMVKVLFLKKMTQYDKNPRKLS